MDSKKQETIDKIAECLNCLPIDKVLFIYDFVHRIMANSEK